MSGIIFASYYENAANVVLSRPRRRILASGFPAGTALGIVERPAPVATVHGAALIEGTVSMSRPARRMRATVGTGWGMLRRVVPALHAEGTVAVIATADLARPAKRVVAVGGSTSNNAAAAMLRRAHPVIFAADTATPPPSGYVAFARPAVPMQVVGHGIAKGSVSTKRAHRLLALGPGGAVLMRRPARTLAAWGGTDGEKIGVMQPNYPGFIGTLGNPILSIREMLNLNATLDATWIQTLQDRLRIAGTPVTLLEALANAGETLTFRDLVSVAYAMLVSESLSIGGSPTANLRHALQLADSLTLVSGVGSALDAQITVAAAFALADSLASVYPNALAENVDLSGVVGATLRAALKLLDAMRVQDGVTPGVTWLVTTDETFDLTEANATTATMNTLLTDGLDMLGELRLEDGAYLAWVVNTETRAFVKYRNFPFNSFAKIGGRYFGCSGDGIYELAGDDDAGEPITAVLRGGLTDLGSSLLKQMPSAYVGYRAGDQMVLKVTVMTVDRAGDIAREEHVYRMEPRQADALRVNRVKLGRGLKSTYWGWELTNIDGADFDVDSFSWYPVVLERRLN